MKGLPMKKILTLLIIIVVSFSLNAQAGEVTNKLGVCLTDSLSGKERKNLAKWVFFAMAAHPEISSYSRITESDQIQANQFVGKLVTRLITEDCPQEAKAALSESGRLAFQQAFGLVGRVAMQELMTDANVSQSFSGFEKYLDKEKLGALDN